MAALLLFTGASHFFLTEGMAKLLPPWVPSRTALIYATGVLEIAVAVGLAIPRLTRMAALLALILLVGLLPANVWGAIHRVDFGGHAAGPRYLLFRVPLQVFFILWLWWFAISKPRPAPPSEPE